MTKITREAFGLLITNYLKNGAITDLVADWDMSRIENQIHDGNWLEDKMKKANDHDIAERLDFVDDYRRSLEQLRAALARFSGYKMVARNCDNDEIRNLVG